MARKMMTKEVTFTTVKLAKLEVVDGQPVIVHLPDETLIGNISPEHAQRLLNKKHGVPVTIFEVTADTTVYEMPVEEFIKLAKVKEEQLTIEEV
jgi:Histone-like Protein p6